MKVEVEPGFKHTLKEPRYFVLRFAESDPEDAEGYRYEIQLLNSGGEGGATLMLREEDRNVDIPEYDLPRQVVAAARRQHKGSGDYVNSEGLSVTPF